MHLGTIEVIDDYFESWISVQEISHVCILLSLKSQYPDRPRRAGWPGGRRALWNGSHCSPYPCSPRHVTATSFNVKVSGLLLTVTFKEILHPIQRERLKRGMVWLVIRLLSWNLLRGSTECWSVWLYVHFLLLTFGATGLQGCTKRLAPGFVKMRWRSCVLLPVVGKQNPPFSPNFTQPGAHLLVHPCTYFCLEWQCGGVAGSAKVPWWDVARKWYRTLWGGGGMEITMHQH